MTSGVNAFCNKNQCRWLLLLIGSYQTDDRITLDPYLSEIQFWNVLWHKDDPSIPQSGCRVICNRDTNDLVISHDILKTDLERDMDIRLYVETGEENRRVIMLPSEY